MVAAAIVGASALVTSIGWEPAGAVAPSQEQRSPGNAASLQPGANLIGWLGEALPVERLREEIPAVTAVESWNPLAQRFAPAEALEPGRGYLIVLSGDEPIQWEPPEDPVLGTVRLRRGRNLVAWVGPDGWTIDRVVQGVGSSFLRAEWSDHVYRPADSDSVVGLPTVKRGAAIWIEVSRNVNWLQPTGKEPTIRFSVGAPAGLKAQVESDLQTVIQFYREYFGLEADATQFIVFIPSDVEALIDMYQRDAPEQVATEESRASLRSFYGMHGGWVSLGKLVVIQALNWYEDHEPSGPRRRVQSRRHLVAHEYAHVLQHQLRSFGDGASPSDTTQWLVEGTATWAEHMLYHWDGRSSRERLRANALAAVAGASQRPLQDDLRSERYRLGLVASLLLAERARDDSIWEFWRLLTPTWFGPRDRWRIDPPWEDAFAAAFGVGADEFYREFEQWRAQQYRQVSGRISFASAAAQVDRELLLGLPVSLRGRADDGSEGGIWKTFSARLDARGEFSIAALPGTYWFRLDLGDCTLDRASETVVADQDLHGVELEIGDDQCVHRVSGRLIGIDGQPLGDTRVYISSGIESLNRRTDAQGRFSILAPRPGDYRVHVSLERCRVYLGDGHAVTDGGQARILSVVDADLDDIQFKISAGLCSISIGGRLINASGEPVAGARVRAFSDNGHEEDTTDADGGFRITVPKPDIYRLRATIDGCGTYFRRGGSVRLSQYATRITIEERDIEGVRFQQSAPACSMTVTGRLLDGDGQGIAEAGIALLGEGDGSAGSYTETGADGAFSLAAPWTGAHRLRAQISGCYVYRQRDGVSGGWSSAHPVRISDAGIADIVVQLGADNCAHRIEGRLLNADGRPRSNQWVTASSHSGVSSVRSDGEGRFSLLIPDRGTYALYVWIDGCAMYRAGNRATRYWNTASKQQIASRDVTGIEFRLPEDPANLCR